MRNNLRTTTMKMVLFASVCTGVGGGCLEDEDMSAVSQPELETPSIRCGTVTYTDSETGGELYFPEVYYPKALASALHSYGLEDVEQAENCEAAREQSKTLSELFEADPEPLIGDDLEGDDRIPEPAENDVDPDEDAVQPRIWNGEATALYNTPVVTLLFDDTTGATNGFLCSGFIVSKRHVLTSAHCVPAAGTNQIDWEAAAGGSAAHNMSVNVYIHPKYSGGVQSTPLRPSYDLALVEMPDNSYTDIMDSSANRFRFHTGSTAIGQSLRLRGTGYRSETPNSEAQSGVSDMPKNDAKIEVQYHSGGYFRAKSTNNSRACRGDSGGPAIEKGNYSQPIVWGVFSGFSGAG